MARLNELESKQDKMRQRADKLQSEVKNLRKKIRRRNNKDETTLQQKIREELAENPKLKKHVVNGVMDNYMDALKKQREDPMFLLNSL